MIVVASADSQQTSHGPTVVSTSTSTEASTEAATFGSPTGAVPRYRATDIAPMSADIAEFVDFLTSHPNDIVELDVMVTLASLDDYLRVDGDDRTTWHLALYDQCFNPLAPSEPPNALDCGGYSLVFLNESVGTSGVGLHRGAMYRIFGYFSVGPLAGPNQGIFSIPLDPISQADVLG